MLQCPEFTSDLKWAAYSYFTAINKLCKHCFLILFYKLIYLNSPSPKQDSKLDDLKLKRHKKKTEPCKLKKK